MTTKTDRYYRELRTALSLRDVDGPRIGDILAEVESHVAETGEDPVAAFGTPKEYAATLAPRSSSRLRWQGAARAALGGVSGWLLSTAVLALVQGHGSLYGLPAWIVLLAGVAVAAVIIADLSRRRHRVVDPRSGREVRPSRGLAFAVVVGTTIAIVAVLGLFLR